MALYRITAAVRTENKEPRRGERERIRYQMLKLLADQPQAVRRSVKVRRVV